MLGKPNTLPGSVGWSRALMISVTIAPFSSSIATHVCGNRMCGNGFITPMIHSRTAPRPHLAVRVLDVVDIFGEQIGERSLSPPCWNRPRRPWCSDRARTSARPG